MTCPPPARDLHPRKRSACSRAREGRRGAAWSLFHRPPPSPPSPPRAKQAVLPARSVLFAGQLPARAKGKLPPPRPCGELPAGSSSSLGRKRGGEGGPQRPPPRPFHAKLKSSQPRLAAQIRGRDSPPAPRSDLGCPPGSDASTEGCRTAKPVTHIFHGGRGGGGAPASSREPGVSSA